MYFHGMSFDRSSCAGDEVTAAVAAVATAAAT